MLIRVLAALFVIQTIRIFIVKFSFLFFEKTSQNSTIINSIIMCIFTIMIVSFAIWHIGYLQYRIKYDSESFTG